MARAERRSTVAGSRHPEARLSRRALLGAAGALAMAGAGAEVAATARRPVAMRAQAEPAVVTFPRPGGRTASPRTEITFRGLGEADLHGILVSGSESGAHSGIFATHADGGGVSFLPDGPFEAGEQVTVRAAAPIGPDGAESFRFEVARPARLRRAPDDLQTDDPRVPPREWRSRPDLRPPEMEITMPASNTAEGYIFLGARVRNGQPGALIIDNAGEPIWFHTASIAMNAFYDVRVQAYRGEPVLTFAEANAGGPVGWRRGHYKILDASYQQVAAFQIGNGITGGDHHDFEITPEGTALVGAYHPIRWDLSPYGGPRGGIAVDNVVQELEIETGRVLFEWHSLDHIEIDESYSNVPDNPERQFDYLHMNSIHADPNGDLLINGRHTFAVYKLDRATGEVVWRLNGKRSDFDMGEGAAFAYAHDARMNQPGRLTIFDNATSGPSADVESRGLVLRLDEAARTATMEQEYLHPESVVAVSQANVQTLANGNIFIGWGSAPHFSEFTADGEMIFNGRFPRGGSSYRAYRHEWVGRPVAPPVAAVEVTESGEMTVYASWNGATEVARWRVLGGAAPHDLTEIGAAARAGFETAISAGEVTDWVAVEALGADGAVLGASEAVQPEVAGSA